MRRIAAVLMLAALAACGRAKPTAPAEPGAAVRLPDAVVPISYRLWLDPDAPHMSFNGSVAIAVQAVRAAPAIVLNAADLSLDRVSLDGAAAKSVKLDPAAETATLDFGHSIRPGPHILRIDYRGRVRTESSGLFALDYDTPQGKRRMLVSQFENADARRVVPCWDEPDRKATFQLTLAVPAGQMAVSNTPAASTQAMAGGGQRVTFAPTPKMSSYLLFLAEGDLERVSRKVGGVDIGVVVRRGSAAQARFALDQAAELLPWYERYFAIPYPLPKLDLVAAPGAGGFGAMENWGAIMGFEQDLLIDPKLSTQEDRDRVAIVVAHEMAHQWFGDLVTMAWWDDLWLNESFADWMESKSLDALHPDWRIPLREFSGREQALQLDASSATHPVVQPAETVEQMNDIGDAITYDKGGAVIGMLEAHVGEDVWRDGVRAYLRRHAYGSARRDDLWAAVNSVARQPIDRMARDFTEQAGVPLVQVEIMAGHTRDSGVFLTERRFTTDPAGPKDGAWRIPVVAQGAGGGPRTQAILRAGPLVQALENPSPGPLVINPGLVGYYRVLYSPSAMRPLLRRFPGLQPADQLGMLSDAWALGQTGDEPLANFMDLAQRLPRDADAHVWSELMKTLLGIDRLYTDPQARRTYRAWARGRLQPLLGRLGMDPRGRADNDDGPLRHELLVTLGRLDDPGVAAWARSRLPDLASLSPEQRQAVLAVAGEHADAAVFAELRAKAAAAVDPMEKRQLLVALGGADDEAIARQALELSLAGEVPVTLTPLVIHAVAATHPALAFAFARAHQAVLYQRLDPSQHLSFIPGLLGTAADAPLADELHAYAQAAYPPGGRREAQKVEAGLRARAEVRRLRLPEIDRWLRSARPPSG